MQVEDGGNQEDKHVWLTESELETLVEEARMPEQRLAFRLAGQAGLRRAELLRVARADFDAAREGFLEVPEDDTRSETRTTLVPPALQEALSEYSSLAGATDPLIDAEGTTVYRWVRRTASRLRDSTGEQGWGYLNVRDLRRSWANNLLWNHGVLPTVVMLWGGWNELDRFQDIVLGELTDMGANQQREGVASKFPGEGPTEVGPNTQIERMFNIKNHINE